MPRTVIPALTVLSQESIQIATALVDTINGNMFLNNGSCFLYVSNTAGATCTVNILAVPDIALRTGTAAYIPGYQYVLPASRSGFFGPFTQAWWNQRTVDIGYVHVNFDKVGARAVVVNF